MTAPKREDERCARFRALYEANYDVILGYALRRTLHADALDVVAETFTVAWRRHIAWSGHALLGAVGTGQRVLIRCSACDDTKAPLAGAARPRRREQKYPRRPHAWRLETMRALEPLSGRGSRDLVVDTVIQPEGGILTGSGFDSQPLRQWSGIAGLSENPASPVHSQFVDVGNPSSFTETTRDQLNAPPVLPNSDCDSHASITEGNFLLRNGNINVYAGS